VKIISITNQKGGVGKTTTSINLSIGLANKNKKVLLIDLDPQANATTGVGVIKSKIEYSSFDLLTNHNLDINDVIIEEVKENLDMIPSSIKLSATELYLSKEPNAEKILNLQLKKLNNQYNYVIIDCPPSLGILNKNALVASNSIIIPVQAEYFALEGLTQLISTINLIKQEFNTSLKIEGILFTMFSHRTNISKEIKNEIIKFFGKKVYKTTISRSIKVTEAQSEGKSIEEYMKNSKTSQEYQQFVEEVISQNE